ncbi:LADA_0C02432g1_1 [Lachancea dasiensis]|uniref:LADA_0C02432g1_1 n=1 Tax=Lachancea dasiensis TaxID=1072105 RepID=A0A1G4IY65_9SACH|nr:LADA_0C02432g1_1 [Lachancea dasiensis]
MEDVKVAVVTGASSGIGFELTKQLANKGYKVYAAARRVDRITPLQTEFPNLVVPVKLDVAEPAQIATFKLRLQDELPGQKLDLLYNNAGQSCTFPAVDVSNENLEMVFKVNVFGPINLCRELIPFLLKARGTIVFTGSLAGLISFPFGSVYSATKSAIHSYARGLHLEMKPFGVKVLNVITGGVATDIADKRSLPEDSIYNIPEAQDALEYRRNMAKNHKPMSASEYVSDVLKDVESSRRPVDVYHGSFVRVAYWLSSFVPAWIMEKIIEHRFKLDTFSKKLGKPKAQ